MSNQVLLNLLHAGLLTTLGDVDQRRERAEGAAARVAEWLGTEGRLELASALLHSIDESIETADHPALSFADECLLEQWPLFRNAFPEPPVELLRAIVFQAAIATGLSNQKFGAVLSYALRTVETLQVSVGRWQNVVRAEAERVHAAVEKLVEATWLPTPSMSKLRMPPTPELDESGDVMTDLRALAEKTGEKLRSQLESQWQFIYAAQLRERLLWWHTAAHSDTLGRRYVEAGPPALRSVAAAIDIWRLSPAVAPHAIEHLLAATVDLICEGQATVAFADVAEAWHQITSDREIIVSDGGLVLPALSGGDSSPMVSIVPETLATRDVAALVYRDLQIARLLHETNS